jgi:hypothetical protein
VPHKNTQPQQCLLLTRLRLASLFVPNRRARTLTSTHAKIYLLWRGAATAAKAKGSFGPSAVKSYKAITQREQFLRAAPPPPLCGSKFATTHKLSLLCHRGLFPQQFITLSLAIECANHFWCSAKPRNHRKGVIFTAFLASAPIQL